MGRSGQSKSSGAAAEGKRVRTMSTAQLVNKKIHDNCRGLTGEQVDCMRNCHGRTLREQLHFDVINHQAGKDPKTMGALYYASLREQFYSTTGAHAALEPECKDETVRPELVQCMLAAQKVHADRQPFVSFMRNVASVNDKELCGMCRWFLTLKPRNIKQLSVCLEAVSFCVRLSLPSKHATRWAAVKQWADECLTVALEKSRTSKCADSTFVDLHRPALDLFMPKASLDKVLGSKGQWTVVADDLKQLVSSSAVGLQLFYVHIEGVVAENVAKSITAHVEQLSKLEGPLDETAFLTARRACLKEVENIGCVDMLPHKRNVIVSYRKEALQIGVTTWQEEVEIKMAACVKGLAVDRGVLPKLFCEDLLITAVVEDKPKLIVPASMVAAAKVARTQLGDVMAGGQADSGDLAQVALAKHGPRMLLTDPFFKIEMAMVHELTGERSSRRLLSGVLACFPSGCSHVFPEVCVQKLEALLATPRFKLSDRGSQEKCRILLRLMSSVCEGRPPQVSEAIQQCDFLRPALSRFQFFICDSTDSSVQPRIHGLKAVETIVEQVHHKCDAKTATAEDILVFKVFRFMLTPALRTKVDDLIERVEKLTSEHLESNLRKRARTKSRGSGAASSSKCEQPDSALNAAMSMFA